MSLFIGLISLSTCFAIFITGGKTIMLGFVFFLLIYFLENKKRKKSSPTNHHQLSIKLGLLFGAVFVFTWSFLSLGQFDSFPYHVSNGTNILQNDYLINSFRSYYLGVTGEENYYHIFNTLDDVYHDPKPYHYLEMWTSVAMHKIFGGLLAAKFVLVSNTLFLLTTFLGVMALWEKYVPLKWIHLFFCCVCFFVAGLHLPFYDTLGVADFSLPIFTHRVKMFVYYPFILAFLLYYEKINPQLSILFLLGLMLATIVVAPAVLGGVGLFLLYLFFIQKNKKGALVVGGYTALITIFIFGFYKLTDSGNFNIRENAAADSFFSNLINSITDSPLQKVSVFLKVLFREAILYLPLALFAGVLFFQKRNLIKKNGALITLSVGIILSGAVAFAIFKEEKDANQLFYNIVNAFLNCLLILVIIKLISDWSKNTVATKFPKKYYLLGVVGILIFSTQSFKAFKKNIYPSLSYKPYSETYLNEIKSYVLADEEPNLGAAIKGGNDFKSGFSKQTAAYTLGYYLAYMENGSLALNISDYDIQEMSEEEKRARNANLFYRFVNSQKESNTYVREKHIFIFYSD